jgi:hypothetical protein
MSVAEFGTRRGKTNFNGANRTWKMLFNLVPLSLLRVSRREAKAFRPATDARVLDSTKISGLSGIFGIFILALRNLSKAIINCHSSLGHPVEFQYVTHSEPRISTLSGITID